MLTNIEIPKNYYCSITFKIMIDPVIAADGYTYEREAVGTWLQDHDTSPRTGGRLEHKNLTATHDKRGEILEFLDSRPELYEGSEVYLPESWVAEFVTAIKCNQLQEVQRWLDKDRRLLTVKLEGDSTAIHLACEFGSPELVNILLKPLEKRDPSMIIRFNRIHLNMLLQKALNESDYTKCDLLLKLDAEIEQPETTTRNTLLHRRVIQGDLESVSWLLEQNTSLESRNREGNTPLLLSIIHGYTQITEFLLKMNANPQTKNAEQKTPFYIAVEKGDMMAAKLLLSQGTTSTLSCGAEKLNALHIAIKGGDPIMLQYLLQTRVAALIDEQNIKGDTPLHLAVEGGHDPLIFLLLTAGASSKIKNAQGQTAIELAGSQGKRKTANLIVEIEGRRKKAKLKEVDESGQANLAPPIETKNSKAAFQSQAQDFKNQFTGIQQINEKSMSNREEIKTKIERLEQPLQLAAPPPLTPSGSTLIFRPPSPSISSHIPAAIPNLNRASRGIASENGI